MRTLYYARALPILFAIGLLGCEAKKSENPLSPSVAGPLAGVDITQPRLLEPTQGFKVKESQQPLKLVIENSTTSGVRPRLPPTERPAAAAAATALAGCGTPAPLLVQGLGVGDALSPSRGRSRGSRRARWPAAPRPRGWPALSLRADLVELLDVVLDHLPLVAALLGLAEDVERAAAQALELRQQPERAAASTGRTAASCSSPVTGSRLEIVGGARLYLTV